MARSRKVTVSTDAHGRTVAWSESPGAAPEVPTPAPSTAAAFFDVDNTMMQGASIYWFARGLAARKYFTTGDLARFAWQQARFRLFATERAGDMSQAKEAALAFIHGWRVDDVETARRGDLRRADGTPDLGGHPTAGTAAPGRG